MTRPDNKATVSPKTTGAFIPSRWRGLVHGGIWLTLIAGAFLGLVWICYDFHLVEKILTAWAMPSGLFALTLLLATLCGYSSGQRATAMWGLALFLLYGATSNSYTASLLGRGLEGRYALVDPLRAESYDAIIVLGGGVKVDEDGNASLGTAGDRLMLAARLFHSGKVQHLIATGASYRWSGGQSYAEGTRTVWTQLGIPASRMSLVEGVNTSQEMRELKALFASDRLPFDSRQARIGLLTSAMHLPRAERLARNAGFDFEPIAADFLTPVDHPFPLAIQPNAEAIFVIRMACKEYLAAVVGR